VLGVLVGGIEVDQLSILVGLVVLNQLLVFVQRKLLAIHIAQQAAFLGFFPKLLFGQDAVLDEDFQVVPFLFILLAVVLEQFVEAVGYFLGDVARDFLDVVVALQV